MADLLIELISEEIPARMQAQAARSFDEMIRAALAEAGLVDAGVVSHAFVAPRHLALYVENVAMRQSDVREERRGPRADAPDRAIEGFVASTGLARGDLVERDTPKGTFLFAMIERKGMDSKALLPGLICDALAKFSWPKSQRWGETKFRWVRPLHRVNVLLDGKPLSGELDLGGGSLKFTASSRGHYFEAPRDIDLTGVKSAREYVKRLEKAYVMVDREERRKSITSQAEKLAGELRANEALIDEITGLVEWPVALAGTIEKRFMALPDEVLEASLRIHQKYLATCGSDGTLAPGFVLVSNRRANKKRDRVIMEGNQRVLRARLADAEFFWAEDIKTSPEARLPQLEKITFYKDLGSIADKAGRIERLAGEIAGGIKSCDAGAARRAGLLAKSDLASGMVGEFPELQGVIGGYYATHHKEAAKVARALAEHYRPQGPGDDLPSTSEGVAVSLADKIDSLVGFFAIGARPTGSKDPLALRRAALGVIRIIIEKRLRVDLAEIFTRAARGHDAKRVDGELMPFMRERLRVGLRDKGVAHDVVAAALGEGGADDAFDVLGLADRAEALGVFLASENGAGLMAGWRRAASILDAEEGKAKKGFAPSSDPARFVESCEGELHKALGKVGKLAGDATEPAELIGVMEALGGLRGPIDSFFDNVVVNDDDEKVRKNRLGLLAMVRQAMMRVADFSKIEG